MIKYTKMILNCQYAWLQNESLFLKTKAPTARESKAPSD